MRPVLKSLLADLWDRQRVFNLILLETVNTQREQLRSHQEAIEAHARLIEKLDRRLAGATTDVLRHNDALFARVDQKLDRYRRESRELWHRLGGLIAAADDPPRLASLTPAQTEQAYLELERRYRGSEEEIAERLAVYLPYLESLPGPVLDLGCGRGESLQVLAHHGLMARGIDSNREMVDHCREKGLDAEVADLFEYLRGLEESSLGAVVSFHVIEHLPGESLDRLIRLAYRALAAGGRLVLETPSPLSVMMAARNFWIDPTHRRPVHPASLESAFREAGFEPVNRLDLHPFAAEERLPEIEIEALPEPQRALADHVNRLRDAVDDLLFGHQDFALIGVKP